MHAPTTTPRRFWQLHLSTAIVLTLVTGTLIGLNGVPEVGPNERAYGWPFPVVTYLGELPVSVRWDWTMAFDVVSNLLLIVYTRVIWEYLTRRRETRARVIHGTTFYFAALASVIVGYLTFAPRAPQLPVKGELCGWPLVIYRDVRYEFDGTESEWDTVHAANKDVISRELGNLTSWNFDRNATTHHFHIAYHSQSPDGKQYIILRADLLADILLVATAAILAEWLAIKRGQRDAKERMHLTPIPNINL